MAGVGIVPPFPPFVGPPSVAPWSHGLAQQMQQLQQLSQPIPWPHTPIPPAMNIRAQAQRPVQFPSTSPLHHPSQVVQAVQAGNSAVDYIGKPPVLVPSYVNVPKTSSQQTVPNYVTPNLSGTPHDVYSSGNVNSNLSVKNSIGSPSQQQYATGVPLYRRSTTSSSSSIQPPNPVQQPQQLPFDDRGGGSYNQPYPGYDQNPSHVQQKLTQDELNFISRALEQHASSSGEPFHGDIQTLRTKLMHAVVSSGDTAPVRPTSHGAIMSAPQYPAVYATEKYLPAHQGANGPISTGIPSGSSGVSVAQKSPVMPADSSRYMYNSSYQDSSSMGASLQNRVWSAPNTSFPTPNESINPVNAPGYPHPQQNPAPFNEMNVLPTRNLVFPDPNLRGIYPSQSAGAVASNNTLPQQGLPNRSVSTYNNNSILSNYEYGSPSYQSDVGGLKAQLSGGIRQGFGDRSAFSRVYNGNGNQDMEISSDNSGLGRSYANVVKAAVTAAVGAGVSTSTLSITSASNVSRLPGPVPSAPISSNVYPNTINMYGGGPGVVPSSHTHFVPQL